ncbi:hypothetical protein [Pararhodobacter sp.]|uniref:hypothetical protein n=1 Tax=Pararhodobacter sp. TaxID=2127056 RepID=UPI002FDCA23A
MIRKLEQRRTIHLPISHAFILCFGFVFGSLIAESLKASGFLNYPFYVTYLPGEREFSFALIQCIVFCATVLAGQRLLGKPKFDVKTFFHSKPLLIKHRHRVLFLAFIIVYGTMITIYSWDSLSAEYAYRHSGNHDLSRFTLLLVTASIVVFSGGSYAFRLMTCLFLIYLGTLSGAAGASRSTAIPFLLVSFSFLQRKNYVTGAVFFYLSLIAIRTAFAVRGDPSFLNYWEGFFYGTISFELISVSRSIMQSSFPGLATIQASMTEPGTFSIDSVFWFLVYVSPVPSSFLPGWLFSNLSLSYVLGIDKSVLGINYDIFSEGIFWFGTGFAWIYTIFLGIIVLLPYYCATYLVKAQSSSIYVLCLMVNMYMVYGGQVFILRSGSRAVFALSLLFIAYWLVRRLKFRPVHYKL